MTANNGVDGGSLFNVINDARTEQTQTNLGLAIQQAQELADKYEHGWDIIDPAKVLMDLLALFKAAR